MAESSIPPCGRGEWRDELYRIIGDPRAVGITLGGGGGERRAWQ